MKILLLADVRGWAWDRNASTLKKYLPQYNITRGFFGNEMAQHKFADYDHIHAMGWLPARGFASITSAGVCSHNYELRREDFKQWFPKYKALIANSPILFEKVKPYNPHVFYCPNGVHEDLFLPKPKEIGKEFVVGWVGQQTHGGLSLDDHPRIDIKGYECVLKPLMKRLEGKGIRFKILSNNYKNAIPYDKMPEFYDDVDCQICTSFREGTPNPMFEAASCGKALVSTRVGAISSCIEHGESGFLIDAYDSQKDVAKTIDRFEEYIILLKNDRDLCSTMGNKSRDIIERDWTWRERVKDWIPLFEYVKNK